MAPGNRLFSKPSTEHAIFNSLIEAWWRSLKHQWLYLHQLDSIATVRRLVGFYVREHNQVMPHSAFNSLTPDEVYFGRTERVVESLAAELIVARAERVRANQSVACPSCPRSPHLTLKRKQRSARTRPKTAARTFARQSPKCSASELCQVAATSTKIR